MRMKMFLSDNLSVDERQVKINASASSGELEAALCRDWAEAQTIWQIVDSCFAYVVNLFCIRPHDYSG